MRELQRQSTGNSVMTLIEMPSRARDNAVMFFDAALKYDPQSRSCDLELGADGDLVLDATPITPMLLSVELDARAAADDPLPQAANPYLTAAGIDVRRGSACDCLDPVYAPIGSKCWLLERAKQTEDTRLAMAMWLEQALLWVAAETGIPAIISVSFPRRGIMHWRAAVAGYIIGNNRELV